MQCNNAATFMFMYNLENLFSSHELSSLYSGAAPALPCRLEQSPYYNKYLHAQGNKKQIQR